MKNLLITLITVIAIIFSMSSCTKSRAELAHDKKNELQVTTINNVQLDNSIKEFPVTIVTVDDETQQAYGYIFLKQDAKSIKCAVSVPYDCLSYNVEVKSHYINMTKFIKELNSESNRANVFIDHVSLEGFAYNNK